MLSEAKHLAGHDDAAAGATLAFLASGLRVCQPASLPARSS
jgi:hypothetical protein